jgi:hypothetical protein
MGDAEGQHMKFARRVYVIAAVYGIVALVPQYFMEEKIGRDFPPPIMHPEQFYGFIGVALAWQVMFLVIARDPLRFRPAMPVTVLEKITFAVPCAILFVQGRIAAPVFAVGMIDLVLATLFTIAWVKTRT